MSYDISLGGVNGQPGAHNCDHLQILERYAVNFQDFRTLQYKPTPAYNPIFNMRAPISGASAVRLWLKGVLVHPEDLNYGYSIIPDPDRIQEANLPFQKIVFNQPMRELNSLIEVTYFTQKPFCLKCSGTGLVVDWTVSPSGHLNQVHGKYKLAQQVLKYSLTSTNPFNPKLTTPIRKMMGKKFGITVTDQDIATSISQALIAYQSIQQVQSRVQTLVPNEILKDLQSVSAVQDADDPTIINISISVTCYGSTDAIPLNLALQTK